MLALITRIELNMEKKSPAGVLGEAAAPATATLPKRVTT